jgi:hypothetical protein
MEPKIGTCSDENGKSRIVFRRVDFRLSDLLTYINTGDIGLPDIQRPFVWKPTKVRDLFDSMYKGFPVGYLLFWDNQGQDNVKQIGVGNKTIAIPKFLVIDGQQRLTSLYSVINGKPVKDENYNDKRIEIAFRPRDGRFEVSDAAIKRDPEFIPDISILWTPRKSSRKTINEFIAKLGEKKPLNDDEEETISDNIDRIFDVYDYPFTALEISSVVDEEQVADIFIRINSQGVTLGQADFILTLMSVYWEDGRRELERFSREAKDPPKKDSGPSPYNHYIKPAPDQLLRVAVALGFSRGRLKSVYQILLGKDPDTRQISAEKRGEQFVKLMEAQKKSLDLTHWHQFFNSLRGAGYPSAELISSDNTLLYSYAFYLIGRTRFGVPVHELDLLIGRWFYASSISGRYTSSPETVMEGDLNQIKDQSDGDAYVNMLNKIMSDTLTNDFWEITLPNLLDSSASVSPIYYAFNAAQIKLGAPVLFSQQRIGDLLDPTVNLKKKYTDKHHLFPKGWLQAQGISDLKVINQLANFTLLEWPDNIEISDNSPQDYLPRMRQRFDADTWNKMSDLHALPDAWEFMQYNEFLVKRRALMAKIIRRGFESLSDRGCEIQEKKKSNL